MAAGESRAAPAPPPQRQAKPSERYRTEGELLEIVRDLQTSLDRDTYRYPVPKDGAGMNVFKATLVRLADYEAKRPGAYPDLVAYTQARAYERLRAYDKAAKAYERVAQANGRLATEAQAALAVVLRFRELKSEPMPTAATPLDYLKALDGRAAAWRKLAEEFAATRFESLARQEEERIDRAKVAFLELNRHRFEDGNTLVVLAYRKLLDKHGESKNIHRYRLDFGDFYVTLARDYVARVDPQGLDFDGSTFQELTRSALRLYAQVAQEDGVMEKLEARGKLTALEAYMATIGRLSR
jgi:hypothetical protein